MKRMFWWITEHTVYLTIAVFLTILIVSTFLVILLPNTRLCEVAANWTSLFLLGSGTFLSICTIFSKSKPDDSSSVLPFALLGCCAFILPNKLFDHAEMLLILLIGCPVLFTISMKVSQTRQSRIRQGA